MNATSNPNRGACLRSAVALTGVFMLAACASTPPPTASLEAARTAISNAERADAGRYAAGELAEARTKLASADTAVTEKNMIRAERLAEQSRTEAELASARTAAEKAKAVNREMQQSTDTLIEEMRRKSPQEQP